MKKTALLAVLAMTLGACTKTPPPQPPPPPPPAAPATPPPAPPPPEAPAPQVDEYARLKSMASDEIDRLNLLGVVYFDLDSSDLREGDKAVLAKNAEVLKKFDFLRVTVEGHADERGTVEYNLALGERRARSVHEYLISLGVPGDRLKPVSYGKEIPACTESTEDCWARNRRVKSTVTGKTR